MVAVRCFTLALCLIAIINECGIWYRYNQKHTYTLHTEHCHAKDYKHGNKAEIWGPVRHISCEQNLSFRKFS